MNDEKRSYLYTGGQRMAFMFVFFFVLEVVVIIKGVIFSQPLGPYKIKLREAKQVTAKLPSCPHCHDWLGSRR